MATTINLDRDTRRKLEKGLTRPLKKTRQFFSALATTFIQDTAQAFMQSGARGGHRRWKQLAMSTVKTPAGTWRIRKGTDGTPAPLAPEALASLRRRWGWGHKGEMRSGVRRYQSRTKNMLQASGFFKQSFGIMKITERNLLYGTKYKLAETIMSKGGGRQVLFITASDEKRYLDQFAMWFLKGLKF
jgi:hypothetical protein